MPNGPNDVVATEARDDGAAFDHTPAGGDPGVPGEGKPDASEADEGTKLAGKFDSPEELEKAYKELQAKFTKERQGEGEKATAKDTPDPTDGTIKSAREAAEAAAEKGVDMDALNREWMENGELSDDTYEDLEKRGFDRDTVDDIIEGQKARAQSAVNRMADVAGGQEELNAVLRYAAKNLTESEANAYDSALQSGDLDTAATLLRGIMARRADDVGTVPSRKTDGERAGQGERVKPFGSRKAMSEAMQDPRYRTDSDYRERVLARAAVTE